MSQSLYEWCVDTQNTDLLHQWDAEKNGALSPSQVTFCSNQKVWWRCKEDHQWQAKIKSRVYGVGCPICAGRTIQPGFNDLATTHPELVSQWNREKNIGLTPEQVSRGSTRKVWWRCKKGHEWQAAINSRAITGADCPYCAGKIVIPGQNDLASQYPSLAYEWNDDRNGELKPESVMAQSNRRVWWRCSKGHEYRAAVAARTGAGQGCPYCAGQRVLPGFNDLQTLEPIIAAQWHPTLNEGLTPEMVTRSSNKKVWWQCPEGHVWQAAIYSRTGDKRCGCPACAGQVKSSQAWRYRRMMEQYEQEMHRLQLAGRKK